MTSRDPIVADVRTAHVTVYEDRAEVTRRCRVRLPGGAAEVALRALSPLIDEARLIARFDGVPDGAAQVDDVVVIRRTDVAGADVIEARRLARAEARSALERVHAPLAAALKAAEQQRAALESLAHQVADVRARRMGRGDVDTAGAAADHERLAAAYAAADARLLEARAAVLRSEAALTKARAEPRMAGRRSRPVCDVVLRVSSPQPVEVEIVVATVLPCAAWRPSHEAALHRDGEEATTGAIRFVGHGAVWNRTGEDWVNAPLTLSTARPSQGAELPTLAADRLRLRQKTAEERKTIVVEHRSEAVPKSATQGGAPGVDDGGEVRAFRVATANIPDDGRPHRVELFRFEAPCAVARVAVPEKSELVFFRASFKNAGSAPILAGPVALTDRGAFIGTGDLLYCGVGDDLDVAFGSDDGLRVTYVRRELEEKKLIGKNIQHWVQEATITSTRKAPATTTLLFRLPVSELQQVKVLHSALHSTVPEPKLDAHGLARLPLTVEGGHDKSVAVAFTFDVSGDVRLPDPW